MFELVIDTRKISVRRREKITAGSVGIRIGFEFSSDWEGLGKTAVFETDRHRLAVVLSENTVTLPWEVCEEAGLDVSVGVYGTNSDGSIVIPTVWTKLETVSPGADCSDAENARTPTASDIQQITAAAASAVTAAGKAQVAAEKAEELASDVKARADRGEFNGRDGINGLNGRDGTDGYTPVKGVDYFDGTNGADGSSVTITGIAESTESGGTSTVTFSDGRTLSVKNGRDGQGGSDVTADTVRGWGFAYMSELPDTEQLAADTDTAGNAFADTLLNTRLCSVNNRTINQGHFREDRGTASASTALHPYRCRTTVYAYSDPRTYICAYGYEMQMLYYGAAEKAGAGDTSKYTGEYTGWSRVISFDALTYVGINIRRTDGGLITPAELAGKLYVLNETRTDTVSAESTENQIPSAKAVWELFNSIPNAEGVGF